MQPLNLIIVDFISKANFSTSLYNHDGDGGRYNELRRGKYYSKKFMVNWPYPTLKRTVKNNGGKFPCNCEACKSHSFEEADSRWADFRKEHHVLVRNEEMKEVKRAILDQNIELAMVKLRDSDLGNLASLIPRL